MRCIIAGSRDIHDYALLERAIASSGFAIDTVLSGAQRGVDAMGERWSLDVLGKGAERYAPANHTDAAYRERNLKMARAAEALIAVPGRGQGTANMLMHARAHGLKVYVHELEG